MSAAAAILAVFVLLAIRTPLAIAAIVLATFFITQGIRDSYQFPLHFGSTNIYLLDLLSLALVAVGIYRAVESRRLSSPRLLVFALLLLLGVHFLRGVADYGLTDAFNKSRGYIYFIAPIVYAATVKRWDARVWRLLPVTGLALLGLACFYYVSEGYHAAGEFVTRNGSYTDVRPITAAGALVVLDSVVLLSILRWPSRRVVLLAAMISAVGLIALQERTVWIAAAAAGFVGLCSWAAARTWNARQLAAATAASLASVCLIVPAFLLSHSLRSDITEVTNSNSTFSWRVTGWRGLISKYHSFTDMVFGLPSGMNLERKIGLGQVNVSAHSLYVDQYLRFGIPGVILIVVLGFLLWRRRQRIAPEIGLTPTCVALLLLVMFVFGIAWQLNSVQGLILGVLVAAASTRVSPPFGGSEEAGDASSDALGVADP